MDKKPYETPELQILGDMRELTALTRPTECSALEGDFGTEDNLCEIPDV
jgi:hypothetical protein